MSLLGKLFGGKANEIDDKNPFMEHPTGEFEDAITAIESAMNRLLKLKNNDKWIIFCGQGKGSRQDSYQIANVPFLNGTFDLKNEKIKIDEILDMTGIAKNELTINEENGQISLHKSTPKKLAILLNAIFTKHFGIIPHDGETDYAVGAEWK